MSVAQIAKRVVRERGGGVLGEFVDVQGRAVSTAKGANGGVEGGVGVGDGGEEEEDAFEDAMDILDAGQRGRRRDREEVCLTVYLTLGGSGKGTVNSERSGAKGEG